MLCQLLWFSSSYSGFPHTGGVSVSARVAPNIVAVLHDSELQNKVDACCASKRLTTDSVTPQNKGTQKIHSAKKA